MKSYIQGFITGGVFVFAFMILTGTQKKIDNDNHIGKYQMIIANGDRPYLFNTQTGAYQRKTDDKVWSRGLWEAEVMVPPVGFVLEK